MIPYDRHADGNLVQAIARANATRQGAVRGDFGYIEGSEVYARTDGKSIADTIRNLPSQYRARAAELLNSEYSSKFLQDVERSDLWKLG